jgi:hypothetical protein
VAVEEDGDPEARPSRLQLRLNRPVIGTVDALDPPGHLGGRDALAPDRARTGDPRRDQAEAAPGPGRFDGRVRRRAGQHHRRVELALVAVEVDLGARRIGDQGRRSVLDGAPDQPVDEPVLETLEAGAGNSRRGEQPVRIGASGVGHRKHHRRAWPGRSEAAERGRGVGHSHLEGK